VLIVLSVSCPISSTLFDILHALMSFLYIFKADFSHFLRVSFASFFTDLYLSRAFLTANFTSDFEVKDRAAKRSVFLVFNQDKIDV
jgi:hypothetical protein